MNAGTKPTVAELWPLKQGRPTKLDTIMRQVAEFIAGSDEPNEELARIWNAMERIDSRVD